MKKWIRAREGNVELNVDGNVINVLYSIDLDPDQIRKYVFRALRNKNRMARGGPVVVRIPKEL